MISKLSQLLKDCVDSKYITVDIENGIVYGHKGKPLKIVLDRSRLCSVNCKLNKLSVHRIVAYAKFGDAALEPGMDIDHIDHNTMHNQGDNLRILPHAQNANEGRKNAAVQRQSMAYKVISPETSKTIAIFNSLESAKEYSIFKFGVDDYAVFRRRKNGTWHTNAEQARGTHKF